MREHDALVARIDDVAAELLGPGATERAIALLDEAEAASRAALVDEGERARLQALAPSRAPGGGAPAGTAEARPSPGPHEHWHPVLAQQDGRPVGYVGLVVGPDGALGDVALDPRVGRGGPALRVLLEAARRLAEAHGVAHLDVWVRHAADADVVAAAAEGFAVARRLAVLGRALPADAGGPRGVDARADAVEVRPAADDDVAAVVRLLDAAYTGTPDGGWDPDRFASRAGAPWFRLDDLLVARDAGGRVVGVHWTKRRGGAVGEVYNLAVHPDARGGGVGAALLAAGLAHLAAAGMREVVLWVDLANERALRLYVAHGFTLRWEDVLLRRTTAA